MKTIIRSLQRILFAGQTILIRHLVLSNDISSIDSPIDIVDRNSLRGIIEPRPEVRISPAIVRQPSNVDVQDFVFILGKLWIMNNMSPSIRDNIINIRPRSIFVEWNDLVVMQDLVKPLWVWRKNKNPHTFSFSVASSNIF